MGVNQRDIRSLSGTALTYEGDCHALFDTVGIAGGEYNGRLLAYINNMLGAHHTNLPGAQVTPELQAGMSALNSLIVSNVMNYGAVGDGIANDTAAFVKALATGKSIVVPPGTYSVDGGNLNFVAGQSIFGSGIGANGSVIKRRSNGILLNFFGASTSSRVGACQVQNLFLHGNDLTGNLVKLSYADHISMIDVYFYACNDIALQISGSYDLRFQGCSWEFCGGVNNYSVTMTNLVDDSVNAIWFNQCRWENFKHGCIDMVGNGLNLHGIYLTDVKMETTQTQDFPFLRMTGDTRNIHVNQLYVGVIGYLAGTASMGLVISWTPWDTSSMRNVKFYSRVAGLFSPLYTFLGLPTGGHEFDNITFDINPSPGQGAQINHSVAPNFASFRNLRNAVSADTTPIHGNLISTQMMGDHIPAFAGAVTDASFTGAGMPTPASGQYAIDSTNNRLYTRVGTAWKSAALT